MINTFPSDTRIMDTAPDHVHDLIEAAFATYDVAIEGELTAEEVQEGIFEVDVPFSGEMDFEEVTANQGFLLYNKSNEGELSLRGVRDGKLVLTAKPE